MVTANAERRGRRWCSTKEHRSGTTSPASCNGFEGWPRIPANRGPARAWSSALWMRGTLSSAAVGEGEFYPLELLDGGVAALGHRTAERAEQVAVAGGVEGGADQHLGEHHPLVGEQELLQHRARQVRGADGVVPRQAPA